MTMVLLGMYAVSQMTFRMLLMNMILHGESKLMIKISLIIIHHSSYAVSIILCLLTLVVIVVLAVGLVLGAYGFKKANKYKKAKIISNWGGITLLM